MENYFLTGYIHLDIKIDQHPLLYHAPSSLPMKPWGTQLENTLCSVGNLTGL